jgi:queuine tRNA-ribosyltransferase
MGRQLIGVHNIHFYHDLMRSMRREILADTFYPFYLRTREKLAASDEEFPVKPPPRRPGRPTTLGDYEVRIAEQGFASIRQISSGEVMHSVIPPEQEAKKLYVAQSRLTERALAEEEIILWDVGMGAAANAMAAIRAFEAVENPKARLKVVSFEIDLDSLRLASKYLDRFHYLRHQAPNAILERGEWCSKKFPVEWKLFEGDFLEHVEEAPPPQLIFFDPFSFKTNREFWCLETLERIRARAEESGKGSELFTYSSSTAVRATLLAAGFYVARGAPTGPKGETTIACTEAALAARRSELLGAEWLSRWERSEARCPLTLSEEIEEEVLERIRRHPQFAGALAESRP